MRVMWYLGDVTDAKQELWGFCDASTKAHGAVAYLRFVTDKIRISLVAAKTRIAPVKQITLPRLELRGALLLSDFITTIKNSIKIKIDKTFLRCSSKIAIGWIYNPPAKGKQFVQHRVNKIHDP